MLRVVVVVSPLLIDIVRFGLLRIVVNHTVLETHMLERGLHTHIRNVSFFSPTEMRSHVYKLVFDEIENVISEVSGV